MSSSSPWISREHFQINHIAETAADGDGPAIVIATDWLGRLPGDRRRDGAQRREYGMIYKYIPRERLAWSDVWIGAAVTALLFTIGKFLIGIYLGKSSFNSAYGATGSLVVLLLWIYYSAQIFLLGAEFTRVVTYEYGSRRSSARV